MRRTYGAAAAICTALAIGAGPAIASPTPVSVHGPTARYLVVLEDGVSVPDAVADQRRTLGLDTRHVFTHALSGYAATMPTALADRLEADPRVAYVQRDRRVQLAAQTTPTGVNRAEADLSLTAAVDGTDQRVDVDVAVVDTGVDLDHPDLNVNTAGGKNCALLAFSANDDNGHGSHVAGTIGALDNETGVVGMAPGARIWPVKVLNRAGIGFTSDIVCGIDYVTAHADEIEVANMSLGGAGTDDGNCGNTDGDAEHQAICRAVAAGVTFVVAAGNDAADAAGSAPASYDEVITVSALADFDGSPGGLAASTCRADGDDSLADFSNFGADVDLIAPGVCIESTWLSGGYNTISGTSMASPHVAGGAALYAATHPSATPAQVKAALQGAGSQDWDASDDPDGSQEPLLDVSGF
ncbi:MAG: S8 family serine peptidase [Actinomycetes bacterium]